MKRIEDLTPEQMREALRDLLEFCYVNADGKWEVEMELSGTDTVDAVLDVLAKLGIQPNHEDDGKDAKVHGQKSYLVRSNCEYSIEVTAASSEEAKVKAHQTDFKDWQQAWSETEAERT